MLRTRQKAEKGNGGMGMRSAWPMRTRQVIAEDSGPEFSSLKRAAFCASLLCILV